MMPKTVYIVRGPSGAGKSTYIRERLLGQGQGAVCSADDFFSREGEYDFDVGKLPEAHAWCMGQFLMAIMNECEVIVLDNTSTRKWEYVNYEIAANISGYKVEIVEIVPTTVEQMQMCARRNTHGVPASVIASHCMRFQHDTRAVRMPVNDNNWK